MSATVSTGTDNDRSWADVLSPELAARRRMFEAESLASFSRWGYAEVMTPLVEPYDTLALGAGESVLARTFKFIGPDGRLLALRPDITTPIARLVANAGAAALPARLCYVGPVYRRTTDGRVDEIHQAGAELIGESGAGADAEVIALATEVVSSLGVVGWRIGIGHSGLLTGLSRELGRDPDTEASILEAVASGNMVELGRLLEKAPPSTARDLLAGSFGHTEPFGILGRLADETRDPGVAAAVAELTAVLSALGQRPGCCRSIALDPGVVRDFDYYSGLVFALYVPGLGRAAGGGGRYDRLTGRFGLDAPATGFGICLSDLLRLDWRPRAAGLCGIH